MMGISDIPERSVKCWQIYSIVLGAVTSFLPAVIYTLIFDSKMEKGAAIALWFLTTALILEDWWWTESILRRLPTNSWKVVLASFACLMGILSLPAILMGKGEDILQSFRYYGWGLVAISLLDAGFCVAYCRTTIEPRQRSEFYRYLYMDFAVILGILIWIPLVKYTPYSQTLKAMILCVLYLSILTLAALIDRSYRKSSELS
jgi:hypothetical protein